MKGKKGLDFNNVQFKIKIKPLRDDGWATYATRNLRRVSAKIGPAFTMTRPLQQEAQRTYSEVRRIMRGDRQMSGVRY